LLAAVLIVYLDRDGYRDVQDNQLSFLDCLYYATVSLSTTGYGDITPFTPTARLINVLVITPLRVAFLSVLNASTLERAKSAGLVTVHGDATNSEVLRLASAQHAKSIIVATDDDASAVLVTLTARELAPNAKIIAAAREAENQHLLRQSGADSTVVSSETAGRLLGIATQTPSVVEMMEDLLTPDAGFALAEREVTPKEAGGSPRHLTDIVLGVVRSGELVRVDAPEVDALELGDRLLYIRSAEAER
jgi:voltage-gated potassium channel